MAKEKKDRATMHLGKPESGLISTFSHELRTPLSIIKEGISLLLDEVPGEVNDAQRKILKMAKNNVDRLVKAVEDCSERCQEDRVVRAGGKKDG